MLVADLNEVDFHASEIVLSFSQAFFHRQLQILPHAREINVLLIDLNHRVDEIGRRIIEAVGQRRFGR